MRIFGKKQTFNNYHALHKKIIFIAFYKLTSFIHSRLKTVEYFDVSSEDAKLYILLPKSPISRLWDVLKIGKESVKH